MTTIPAFPGKEFLGHSLGGPQHKSYPGMDLRDYFASAVLQSIIANPTVLRACDNEHDFAELAYKAADAMLKAREEKT